MPSHRAPAAFAAATVAALALLGQATGTAAAADTSVTVQQNQRIQSWAESGQYNQDMRPATVFTVPGNQDANGQKVNASYWFGNADQNFNVYERGGQVVIAHNGYVLDQDVPTGKVQLWQAFGGDQALNTLQIPDNQRWRVLYKDQQGWSQLQNIATGKCLKTNGRDQALTAGDCNTGDATQWWQQF
ncbi:MULTISPECIES: RICIN domain-containing protein [unclassified Streptomyces]|uniref:RICIN domain-containing protein n=1 Tax=unclassified Streptomyces TaxID=2593676 RepID=UPI003824A973